MLKYIKSSFGDDIMKKKILAAVSLTLSVLAFASCSSAAAETVYVGSYWNKDTTNETPAGKTETLEYIVESDDGSNKLWNNARKNDNLTFKTVSVTDENGKTVASSYKTVLTANEDGTYLYKTTLTVYGQYESNGTTRDVADVTETETVFGDYSKGFAPVKSVKTVLNTVPYSTNAAYEFIKTHYRSTTTYEGNDATVKIEILDGDQSPEQFTERAKKETSVSKYNKKAYIDNELMLLLFRNFKHEANMSYSFRAIEPLSGEIKSVTGSIYTRTSTSADNKNSASLEYLVTSPLLKNVQLGTSPRHDYSFNVVRMDFSTSGSTGQNFMRAYYAQSYEGASESNSVRHIPVMMAQPMILNTGFLVYSIKTAAFM